jgi:hypothetical protein
MEKLAANYPDDAEARIPRARVHYEKLASVTAGTQSARPELARVRQVLASK